MAYFLDLKSWLITKNALTLHRQKTTNPVITHIKLQPMQHVTDDRKRTSYALIEQAYVELWSRVRTYILYKINDADDADDITQDVFLRLLEYGQVIQPETAQSMIFTIARNLVFDYLRRHYCHLEAHDELFRSADIVSSDTESNIVACDLARQEMRIVSQLPAQRQRIYTMVRYEGKCVADISEELQLSVRTIENHLAIGRREVRECLRKCM